MQTNSQFTHFSSWRLLSSHSHTHTLFRALTPSRQSNVQAEREIENVDENIRITQSNVACTTQRISSNKMGFASRWHVHLSKWKRIQNENDLNDYFQQINIFLRSHYRHRIVSYRLAFIVFLLFHKIQASRKEKKTKERRKKRFFEVRIIDDWFTVFIASDLNVSKAFN